jgi:hypothetical protein
MLLTSKEMCTSPRSILRAKSVSDKNPRCSQSDVMVIGALIKRSNLFLVVACISVFISSVLYMLMISLCSTHWTNVLVPKDGLSIAQFILCQIDFWPSLSILLRIPLHLSLFRIPHKPPAGSLKVLHAPEHWGGIRRKSQTKNLQLRNQ